MRRALLGALLAIAVLAAPSGALGEFQTGFNDTGLYTSSDAGTRDRWFDATVAARARTVRLDVAWSSVAKSKPANPANPADPAYDFSRYDAAVREAAERNLRVMLTFLSAPAYAEGEDRSGGAPPGTWKVDPAALGDFARAVATRYSGSFRTFGSPVPLPRVRFFEAWNEPNLDAFLVPQYAGRELVAPERYRRMVNAVEAAVSSVQASNQVIAGSLAPYGDPAGGSRTRPLRFLRSFFCLDRSLKRTRCPVKPRFDVLSHHPINLSGPPRQSAIHPDDASSPDLKHVREVLRAAERAGTIAGKRKRHPLWVTEFWWQSFPDGPHPAIPGLKVHGRWIEEALFLFWKAGASVAINLQLVDDHHPGDTLQTGVFLEDGTAKPAFTAFRFPFVLERRSKRNLFAWGKAPSSGNLVIERKAGGGWRREKRLRAKAGKVFTATIKHRGSAKFRAHVGAERSLVWAQGAGSGKGGRARPLADAASLDEAFLYREHTR